MKRKHLQKIVAFSAIMVSILLLLGAIAIPVTNVVFNNLELGTAADLLNSQSLVVSHLKSKYNGKLSLSISLSKHKLISSPNISQGTHNYYYKAKTGISVNGTCSEIATTLLIRSHGRDGRNSSYETFKTVMDVAIYNAYWTTDGTSGSVIDNLVTKSFFATGSSKRGNNDYVSIYNTLTKNIDDGYTTILSVISHSMHAVGYAYYTVTYKTKFLFITTSTTKEEKFVIVNDGWKDATDNLNNDQYSYYPESSFSYSEFVLTKVKI
ncbi:MAG: hypothetical protein LBF68_03185 [Christensenellaceae bacterium]|jgi:hypothetical protein|nr:hypothetical protein [Christensenellaceae bacterium]